jgi:hypothetical protein
MPSAFVSVSAASHASDRLLTQQGTVGPRSAPSSVVGGPEKLRPAKIPRLVNDPTATRLAEATTPPGYLPVSTITSGSSTCSPQDSGQDIMDAVPLLKFARMSQHSWTVTQTKLYDMSIFLGSCTSCVYLINYNTLERELDSRSRLECPSNTMFSLEQKLLDSNALLASWSITDYPQLVGLCDVARQEGNLLRAWMKGQTALVANRLRLNDNSVGMIEDEVCVLAVEQSVQFVLMIRECSALGLGEDCWRHVYLHDLQFSSDNMTMADYLSALFPQFRIALTRNNDSIVLSDVVVKYRLYGYVDPTRECSSPGTHPNGGQSYQTVGVLDDQAGKILSTFSQQAQIAANGTQNFTYCSNSCCPKYSHQQMICHEIYFDAL